MAKRSSQVVHCDWLRSSRVSIASGFSPRSAITHVPKLRRSDVTPRRNQVTSCDLSDVQLQSANLVAEMLRARSSRSPHDVGAPQLGVFGHRNLWLKPQAIDTPQLRSESQGRPVGRCKANDGSMSRRVDTYIPAQLRLAAEQPRIDSLGLQPEVRDHTRTEAPEERRNTTPESGHIMRSQ